MGPSLTTHSHTCLGSLLSCFGAKNKVRVDFLINTLPLLPANVTWNGPQKGHLFDFIFLGLFLCTRASPFGQDSWLIHADIYGSSPAGKARNNYGCMQIWNDKKNAFFPFSLLHQHVLGCSLSQIHKIKVWIFFFLHLWGCGATTTRLDKGKHAPQMDPPPPELSVKFKAAIKDRGLHQADLLISNSRLGAPATTKYTATMRAFWRFTRADGSVKAVRVAAARRLVRLYEKRASQRRANPAGSSPQTVSPCFGWTKYLKYKNGILPKEFNLRIDLKRV